MIRPAPNEAPRPTTNREEPERRLKKMASGIGSTHSMVELCLIPKNFINLAAEVCSFGSF